MAVEDDQQFCLRWNNFQANITSQFETLRDDEDFVDVTLACEGQRLEAHKVVLSACSPFFKELFKSNPCPHPIIFMQDVEAKHIVALLEFMYAGEVNVSQAHLSGFLRTAESLQIRGLTDASKAHKQQEKTTETSINVEQKPASPKVQQKPKPESQNKQYSQKQSRSATSSPTQQPRKRVCKETVYESSNHGSENNDDIDTNSVEDFEVIEENQDIDFTEEAVEPKIELPGYISDEDVKSERLREAITGLNNAEIGHFTNINEEMEIIPGIPNLNPAEVSQDSSQGGADPRKPHSLDPRPCPECGRVYSNLSNLRQHLRLIHHPQGVCCPLCSKPFKTKGVQILRSSLKRNSLRNLPLALDMSTSGISTIENSGLGSSSIFNNNDLMDSHRRQHCTCGGSQGHHGGLVKLGEGVEVCSEQLRGVKWTDWRKLTRGLATVLFSPLELATCSVTGQRWSRAGQHHRPVKPALPRDKVQAIVSYVANMFPNIEVSRIKQVLAYKCKENSTAFKMKSIRYYSDQHLQAQENQ